MGYSTTFYNSFKLNKKLDKETFDFLMKFNEVRHMKRDLSKIMPIDEAVKYGNDGWKYVDGKGDYGQAHDESVVDYNCPPNGLPGLWCQWKPNDDGDEIEWDGGEKFYYYTEWIKFLIENVLKPNGYILNGEVEWQGEENDDRGKIVIKDNSIKVKYGHWEWDD